MGIELAIPAGNDPGVLAQVLRAVADRKVNIPSYCTPFDLDHFTILLVTDAAVATKSALADAGLSCTARSVVQVSDEDHQGRNPPSARVESTPHGVRSVLPITINAMNSRSIRKYK